MKFAWIALKSAGDHLPLTRLAVRITFHCRLPSRACNWPLISVPGLAASPSSTVANASSPSPVTMVRPFLSLASLRASFCELIAAAGAANRYTVKLADATATVVPLASLWSMLYEQPALLSDDDAL